MRTTVPVLVDRYSATGISNRDSTGIYRYQLSELPQLASLCPNTFCVLPINSCFFLVRIESTDEPE
jgi:hypothetical protein